MLQLSSSENQNFADNKATIKSVKFHPSVCGFIVCIAISIVSISKKCEDCLYETCLPFTMETFHACMAFMKTDIIFLRMLMVTILC